MSTRLKLAPAYSGESISVFSVVSLNSTRLLSCDLVSSAQANFQPSGKRMEVENAIRREKYPAG